MFLGIVDKVLQLLVIGNRPGRVVRAAKVDKIHCFDRRFGNEIVSFAARHIDKAAVVALPGIIRSGTAGNYIRIDIDGVSRILKCYQAVGY